MDYSALTSNQYSFDNAASQIAAPDTGSSNINWNAIFAQGIGAYVQTQNAQAVQAVAAAAARDTTPVPQNTAVHTTGGIQISTGMLVLAAAVGLYLVLK